MDSQEVKNLEQLDENFIKEFNKLSAANLQSFEEKNRERISNSPIKVRDAFNSKWEKALGSPYYQPVTAAMEEKKTQRTDPASMNYEGYWEVMFSPKSKVDDQEDVTLSLNGTCLQMKRESAVIIPGSFLEVADHGVYPTYIQLPGQDRKIAGRVKTFPYTVMRKATKKEYMEQKTYGDATTKAARDAETRI